MPVGDDARELAARIADFGGEPPSGAALELADRLAGVYQRTGVLAGDPLRSLAAICPSADVCWARKHERQPRGLSRDRHSENGCIVMPWVGPRYRPGGVCVVGLNIRYEGVGRGVAFGAEFLIAAEQADGLRRGVRPHNSWWAPGTMRDTVAVLRSAAGADLTPQPSPEELVDALGCCARVQAVKCSPTQHRSSPPAAMIRNCPPRFLAGELEVLAPAVVLVYGTQAEQAVGAVAGGSELLARSGRRFSRRLLSLQIGRTVDACFLRHPAHGGWHPAHAALLDSLRERPAVLGPSAA